MNDDIVVRRLGAEEAAARIGELARVLAECVEGGASVSFMLPLAQDTAERFWQGVAASLARGERTLVVAEDGEGIAGTVQLITDLPENQPHRAEIAKLLVRPGARGAGLGERLMRCAEEAARAQGKSVLVLDTASAAAERLYERLGWQRVGTVPDYALLPDGRMCATTFFYKRIEPAESA